LIGGNIFQFTASSMILSSNTFFCLNMNSTVLAFQSLTIWMNISGTNIQLNPVEYDFDTVIGLFLSPSYGVKIFF
jgi:hypothetical protein